jgi:Myb-like DNA-binding domain
VFVHSLDITTLDCSLIMTTILTQPRSSPSASHYDQYTSHYSALGSVRRPSYPSTLSHADRRVHELQAATPITPTQREIRTPPGSVSTPSTASASVRAAATTFHILASSPSAPTPKPIKGPWTPSEDHRLLTLVNELGAEKWVVIASRLGSRTGKQCRERWHNHVNPVLNKAPFSLEEEEAIERYYAEIGPKWAEIAKKLPGRSKFTTKSIIDLLGDNAVKNYWNTTMQRKYRRSLCASSNLSHSTPQRLAPYENWERYVPQGSTRNPSPTPARYHPYGHKPRTPPATPDRGKTHLSPQSLPPLLIPRYSGPSSRSPYSAQAPPSSHSAESSPLSGYRATKQLPDIHTVFASPSPSPNNLQLPPLQRRSLSEPGHSFASVSTPASPTPTISNEVKNRMCLDALLS